MSAETTCCFTFSSESKTWWTILQDSCPGVHKCRLPLPISQKQEEQSFIAVFSFVVFVYPFHILGKLCNFWMAWKCLYFCSIFEVPPLGHICLLWPCTVELCKMDTILLDRIQLLENNYLYNTSELFLQLSNLISIKCSHEGSQYFIEEAHCLKNESFPPGPNICIWVCLV